MMFGLLPLLCFLKRHAKLVVEDGFHGGFAQRLEPFEGFMEPLHGVGQIALHHRQRAELPEGYTLSSRFVQFLGALQPPFIFRAGFGVLALNHQHTGEVRVKRTANLLDPIARLELLRNGDPLPIRRFRQVGSTTGSIAAAKTSERQGELGAGLIAKSFEDGPEDCGGITGAAGLQQLFAAVRLR